MIIISEGLTRTGNIFAVRPGKRGGPPTYAGSHMDTQVSISAFCEAVIDKFSPREEDMTGSSVFTLGLKH